ncbi:AraC family transcriptional regulator [Paenibacillus sp. MMS20-IR301]|uniref:AraC family transcriptional regulator n=1 Tax=Paenibacillus sp. MMS20-IR301 TaxID=2895946 RepID=UPI0028E36D0D|nr:AraC family transcriptional regulator [Paenibacillus sp. MMS20-IR301]WNS44361.1 AraC family transcriptional regulator [Paenibacillus sp. MMS20-IR301]
MGNQHIKQAIAHIKEHLNQTLSRSELAAVAGIDPDHFSRMFKKYTGLSPTDYITQLRMERAKALLIANSLSIKEVARHAGYEDPYHFSRRFKQVVGVAPSVYMRSPELRIVALDGYGHCLALGVVPVAADSAVVGQMVPWNSELVEDLSLPGQSGIDMKHLAALKPDVIIAMNRDNHQELASIAPVLNINVLDDPIYVQLRQIAAFLGKEKGAEDWIKEYEDTCRTLRARLAGIGKSRVAVLRVREQLLQIYGMQNMGYPLYHSLQLIPPERIELQSVCNIHFHSSAICMEEIPYYEADYLFVVTQPDEGGRQRWTECCASPHFQSFSAMLTGQVYELDVNCWLAYDPISIRNQMEEAAGLLLQGLKRRNHPSLAQQSAME